MQNKATKVADNSLNYINVYTNIVYIIIINNDIKDWH